jgi:aminoglycoside phosphotransferase (APT) family kinase protein
VTRLPAQAEEWLAERGVDASGVHAGRSGRALVAIAGDLVLRWYGVGTPGPDEPDAIAHEVAALTAVAGSRIPAPRLVAWSDEPPALLMTRLPGDHRLDASGAGAVLELLEAIHAVTPPGGLAKWTYRGYHEGLEMRRPAWWRDDRVWTRAVATSATWPGEVADPVFIHRDFHPGNLLWEGLVVSGVIDWGDACVGPSAFDLAHYRVNIATLVGPEVADVAFPGNPVWDIEAGLGYLDYEALDDWVGPWPRVSAAVARERLEAFIARALAALG